MSNKKIRFPDGTVYEITEKGWVRLTGRTCEHSLNVRNNGVRRRLAKLMAVA